MLSKVHARLASPDEAHELAEIRLAAMRSSLEAVGRFDPDRARERFLSTFVASDTMVLRADGNVVGFYVLRRHPDHFYLDHLYVLESFQGCGLGKWVVENLQKAARSSNMPIRLMALKESPANAFYAACGFTFEHSEEFDNHYVWK